MTSTSAPPNATSDRVSWWTSPVAQRCGLVLLVLVAYLPVWRAGFVWDDDTHLTANPCIVGPLGLKEVWTTPAANYFPLVLTAFWLEHALWGLQALPYHLVNLALHASSAILLVGVLRRLGVRAPWWGAALWAVHPVQAESVAWVSELTNVQSAWWFIFAVSLYLERPEVPRGRLAPVCVCAAAAMLSKPSTVMLPVVLLLCRWWVDRKWSWRAAVQLAPIFFVALVVSGWTIWEQRYHSQAQGPEWSINAVTRLAVAGRDVWFYAAKLFWPHPLAFVYPRWSVPQPALALGPTVAVAAVWFTLWRQRNGPLRAAFFATTYFLVLLFPLLGFFDVYYYRYSFVADHFQYLAAIGPLAGIAAGIDMLRARLQLALSQRWIACGAAATLGIAVTASFLHAAEFVDAPTLWRATLAANPECWIAETIVGNLDERAGQPSTAAARHRHAIALDPHAFEPHYHLGIAYHDLGRYDDAVREYERALQLNPNDADSEHNLGVSLAAVDKLGEAISHYERALQLRPHRAQTEVMLAIALTLAGRPSEALPHYETAVHAQPYDFKAQYSYARTLTIVGRNGEAIPHFRAAIKAAPNNAPAHGYLGLTLAAFGDKENAATELRQAAELDPANPQWRDKIDGLRR